MGNKLVKNESDSKMKKERLIQYIKSFAVIAPLVVHLFKEFYQDRNRKNNTQFNEGVLKVFHQANKLMVSDVGMSSNFNTSDGMVIPINSNFKLKVLPSYDRQVENDLVRKVGVRGISLYNNKSGKVYKVEADTRSSALNFDLNVEDFKIIRGDKKVEQYIEHGGI